MSANRTTAGRLSIWQAAFVIARRDFVAILFSRAFIFFLLGPLFPIVVGGLAGGIGRQVAEETARPEIGIAMQAKDLDAMLTASEQLAPQLGPALPRIVELKRLEPGEAYDAAGILTEKKGNIAAVVTGSPAAPKLTATEERLERWQGPIALIAAQALEKAEPRYPTVELASVATSGANERRSRIYTAQGAQTLLFLLIMLLAGMVLSNLVEEKGNKIIEVLAAAVPMDAVFLGKLFAMLAVSMVGIALWGSVGGTIIALSGTQSGIGATLHNMPAPGVGWPMFFGLGVIYFAMGYLLLGSIFLAIGSMAATVREVQTLSMPVTMLQLLVFFFANFALTQQGGQIEMAAIAFPLSSPFAMLARAALHDSLWPHLLALGWQAMWVALFVRAGAALFRKRVMHSGPARVKQRRSLVKLVSEAFSAKPSS
jgi:ABC-2 type transport system permease protein